MTNKTKTARAEFLDVLLEELTELQVKRLSSGSGGLRKLTEALAATAAINKVLHKFATQEELKAIKEAIKEREKELGLPVGLNFKS